MKNELNYEQETVRSVFGAYINDLKTYSSKPDRPTIRKLEEVRDKAIQALEAQSTDAVKCDCTTEEIAKSFIEDVEAVKDKLDGQLCEDCRNCKKWNECPCGKKGHENGTSIGYSIGECKNYEPSEDAISREAMLSLQTEYAEKMDATTFWKLRDDIRALPSVTPRTNLAETSQDCISIEPIQWYSQNKDGYLVKGAYSKDEAYVKLTDVYEKIRISEDCISREEVQDLISRWLSDYLLDETREALETINYKVGDMPAVYPERPKGKWLHIYKSDIACECSVCHIQMPITEYFHYCPNCGAEMSGGREE